MRSKMDIRGKERKKGLTTAGDTLTFQSFGADRLIGLRGISHSVVVDELLVM